jgi:hypothetical protein
MSRVIDCAGPEGNVFHIAALAQSWNRQIGNDRVGLLEATTRRLDAEWDKKGMPGASYEDALDTFDLWFKGCIDYEFVNDPRHEDYGEGDYDEV